MTQFRLSRFCRSNPADTVDFHGADAPAQLAEGAAGQKLAVKMVPASKAQQNAAQAAAAAKALTANGHAEPAQTDSAKTMPETGTLAEAQDDGGDKDRGVNRHRDRDRDRRRDEGRHRDSERDRHRDHKRDRDRDTGRDRHKDRSRSRDRGRGQYRARSRGREHRRDDRDRERPQPDRRGEDSIHPCTISSIFRLQFSHALTSAQRLGWHARIRMSGRRSEAGFASAEDRDGAERHAGHKQERTPYKDGSARAQAEEAAAEEPQPGVILEVWLLLHPQPSPEHRCNSTTLQPEGSSLT